MAFNVLAQDGDRWDTAFQSNNGKALTALVVGALCSRGTCNSQIVKINSVNAGVQMQSFLGTNSDGSFIFTVPKGQGIATNGSLVVGHTSNQLIFNGNSNPTTGSVGNPSSARTDRIPDVGVCANFGMTLNTGGLYQTKRSVPGCMTSGGGSPFTNPCTTTVTWWTSFDDARYAASCIGIGIAAGVPILQGITAKDATSIVVQTQQATGVNASFSEIECIAVHD